jgi:DNA-binding GntR family transcriptional regulator
VRELIVVAAWYVLAMSIASKILRALQSPEAAKLAREAETWASDRLDDALAALVAGLERGWDRRGLRFHEMYLRAAYHRIHWATVAGMSTGRKRRAAQRKANRWAKVEVRRKIKAMSSPPFQVGELWVTAAQIVEAAGMAPPLFVE